MREILSLLLEKTDEVLVEKEIVHYFIEGKVIQLATLLIVAPEKMARKCKHQLALMMRMLQLFEIFERVDDKIHTCLEEQRTTKSCTWIWAFKPCYESAVKMKSPTILHGKPESPKARQAGLLKSIRLNIAVESKSIGELSCLCLKEGKLIELAILLMVAHEWLIGKSNRYVRVSLSDIGVEIHRCLTLEMSSAIYEETISIAKFESSNLVRKCKARKEILYSAKLLLKVFLL
ncbi:hypothetical protein COLO4_38609 [Corchorus olitorius]|uniref:Uncharacterized protein n=1 Tax=Corchorus olitorius TaxID=93759 RepID=A0A1R3FTW6_9ROSI|nr:hypothetical protein COLO4_38609 [Corchorus olitorius]